MGAQALATGNVQIIDQLYGAFARGDIAHVLGALDPHVEWIEPEGSIYPGTFTGPEAVLNGVFARLGTEWEGFRVAPEELLDAGTDVVSLGRYSGVYRATGRSMGAVFAHVWSLREGKVVRFRVYADTVKMTEALGD